MSMANQTPIMATDDVNQVSAQIESVKYRMTIHHLPQCVLLLIFRRLSLYDQLLRAGLVCKSWYRLVRDRELWLTVDLTGQSKQPQPGVFEYIFSNLIVYFERYLTTERHNRTQSVGRNGGCKLKLRDLEKVLSYSNFGIQRLYLPHGFGEYKSALAVVLMGEYFMSLLRKCKWLKTLRMCTICDCWSSVINIDKIGKSNPTLKIEAYVHVQEKKLVCRTTIFFPLSFILRFDLGITDMFQDSDICRRIESFCKQELKEKKWTNFRSISKLSAVDNGTSNDTHKLIESACQKEINARDFRECAGRFMLFLMKNEEFKMKKITYDSRKVRNKQDKLKPILPPFTKVMNLPRTYQQPRKGPLRRSGPKCAKQ